MPKKLLSQILKERTETIEYRKIRKQLYGIAQNGKSEMLILKITTETITMLQNEGIKVEKINPNGYDVFKLSW